MALNLHQYDDDIAKFTEGLVRCVNHVKTSSHNYKSLECVSPTLTLVPNGVLRTLGISLDLSMGQNFVFNFLRDNSFLSLLSLSTRPKMIPTFRTALLSFLANFIEQQNSSLVGSDSTDFDIACCIFQATLLLSLDEPSLSQYGVDIPPTSISYPILDKSLAIDVLLLAVESIPTSSIHSVLSLLNSIAVATTELRAQIKNEHAYSLEMAKVSKSPEDKQMVDSHTSVTSVNSANPPSVLLDVSLGRVRFGLLTACNSITKRLSRSLASETCAVVLMLLTSLFPVDERSGLNISGAPNALSAPFISIAAPEISEKPNVDETNINFTISFTGLPSAISHTEAEQIAYVFRTQQALVQVEKGNESTSQGSAIPRDNLTQIKKQFMNAQTYLIFWSMLESITCPNTLLSTSTMDSQPPLADTLKQLLQHKDDAFSPEPLKKESKKTNSRGLSLEKKIQKEISQCSTLITSSDSLIQFLGKAQYTLLAFEQWHIPTESGTALSTVNKWSNTSTTPSGVVLGKHLTNPSLLGLQFDDPTVRSVVLTQLIFFFSFLLLPVSYHKNRILVDLTTRIEANSLLSRWIRHLIAQSFNLLASVNPCLAHDLGTYIRDTESLWRHWKAADCPPTGLPTSHISSTLTALFAPVEKNSVSKDLSLLLTSPFLAPVRQWLSVLETDIDQARYSKSKTLGILKNDISMGFFEPLSKDYRESIDCYNMDFGSTIKYTDRMTLGTPGLRRAEGSLTTLTTFPGLSSRAAIASRAKRCDYQVSLQDLAGDMAFEEAEEWDDLLANDGAVLWRSLRALNVCDSELATRARGGLSDFAFLAGADCYLRLAKEKEQKEEQKRLEDLAKLEKAEQDAKEVREAKEAREIEKKDKKERKEREKREKEKDVERNQHLDYERNLEAAENTDTSTQMSDERNSSRSTFSVLPKTASIEETEKIEKRSKKEKGEKLGKSAKKDKKDKKNSASQSAAPSVSPTPSPSPLLQPTTQPSNIPAFITPLSVLNTENVEATKTANAFDITDSNTTRSLRSSPPSSTKIPVDIIVNEPVKAIKIMKVIKDITKQVPPQTPLNAPSEIQIAPKISKDNKDAVGNSEAERDQNTQLTVSSENTTTHITSNEPIITMRPLQSAQDTTTKYHVDPTPSTTSDRLYSSDVLPIRLPNQISISTSNQSQAHPSAYEHNRDFRTDSRDSIRNGVRDNMRDNVRITRDFDTEHENLSRRVTRQLSQDPHIQSQSQHLRDNSHKSYDNHRNVDMRDEKEDRGGNRQPRGRDSRYPPDNSRDDWNQQTNDANDSGSRYPKRRRG